MLNPPTPPVDRVLYFDCFSGLSGDMTLGALLDLGLEADSLWEALKQVPVSGYRVECQKMAKQHLWGTKVDFRVDQPQPHRTYRDIIDLIDRAACPGKSKP